MFKNYFTFAWRSMTRHKGFTILNILGFTIGITSCLLIGLFIRDELQFDKFVKDHENVYRIYNKFTNEKESYNHVGIPPMFATTLQTMPEVEATSRMLWISSKQLIENGDKKGYEENGYYTDDAFFTIFPFETKYGSTAGAMSKPNTIIITKELSKKYFGGTDPVGKTLNFEKESLEVAAVLEDLPVQFHRKVNYLISLPTAQLPAKRMESWGWQQFSTYLKVKPNTDVAGLEKKFAAIVKSHEDPRENESLVPFFQKLTDIHLNSADFRFDVAVLGNATYVKGLSIVAIFILLIACFNFINLATARSIRRAREVGIRKAIGADRKQLIFQLICETSLLAFISMMLAVVLTYVFLPSLNLFTGKEINFNPLTDQVMLAILLLGSITIGVLAGLYPALMFSKFQPVKVLKGIISEGGKTDSLHWLRNGLVVIQFSLSVLLIVCALIVFRQVNYLHDKDLGLNRDQIMFFPMRGENMTQKFSAFKSELIKNKGISSVSIGYGFPGDIFAGDNITVQTDQGKKDVGVNHLVADDDYSKTMGLRFVAGRDFRKGNESDRDHGWIVNETAVQVLGLGTPESAIGKPLEWNAWSRSGEDSLKTGNIIGVVKDFNFKHLYVKIEPAVIHIFPDASWKVAVKMNNADAGQSIEHVKKVWSSFAPDFPIEYTFLDTQFEQMYKSEEKLQGLLWIFTALAIFVGCIGLFGLAAYAAQQRIKEIGIRKVLGATVGNITFMLSKNFLKMVAIASVIAFPVAWWAMNSWLQNFAYRINVGWGVFVIAGSAAVLIALITVGFQAVKAAISNPVKNLRTE